MRRILTILFFIFAFQISLSATEITVSSEQITNWRFGGSTARLRIVANQQFLTSDSKIIMQGNLQTGVWYKDITCTVSNGTLTIPAINGVYNYLDSTTDSSLPNATYTAMFFDASGRTRLAVFMPSFKVPHSLGTTLSWTQILTYNNGRAAPPLPIEYYTSDQTNALIANLTTIQEVADMIAAEVDPVTSSQTANKVFASPNGSAGTPAWRALVSDDIPALAASKITSGTFSTSLIPSLDVSKITTGTFADSFIPSLAASKITSGTFNTARLGSGTANSSVFLQGDSTWAEAVKPSDVRLERDLNKDYSNNLTTAVSSIGATETFLNCTQPVTVSATVALPKNIKFQAGRECLITVAASQTLTIGTFVNPGNVKVFVSSASGAKVLFSKGAVERINTAWWSGNTSGATITDALSEALESAGASGVSVYLPPGQWYSAGEHTVSSGVCVEGGGNSPSSGINNATTLTLASPTGSYLFKIGEQAYSTCFKNIILDGTGTSGKTGLLFEGTGGSSTTSGDFYAEKVTFQNFSIGLNQNSLGASWQMAQMTCIQCIFQNNTTGVRFSSVNHQWTSIGTNFAIGANGVAFDIVAAGAVLISGSEFAGALSSANFADADVNTGTDTITVTGHPFSTGDTVFLYSNGTLPTGSPAISRRLKIRNATANTVQLEKEDGTDIDITSAAGGGTHTIYRSTSKVMTISGAHGAITFESVQDEGNLTFVQNDASDISGIINITDGSLIQSKIQLNQTCKVNIDKSNIMAHAVQGAATGAVVQITESNFRSLSVDDGYTAATAFNDSDAQIVKEELTDLSVFKTRRPQQFVAPLSALGNPTVPVAGFYHITNGTNEDKYLIQYGRMDTSGVPDYYYSIYREHSTGRSVTTGNQTGFIGYDFKGGDLWVEGAVRGQSAPLVDGATIFIDPRTGNHQYVTLGGNRTFAFATFSAGEQTRADGQQLTLEIIQDATGSRTCTLTTGANDQFAFGTDITSVTCTTTALKRDILTVIYSARMRRWLVTDFKKGF